MAIDFDDVLSRGGDELIQFLHFCVYSVEMAPLFVVLARDYRFRPTVEGAQTLHLLFCAVNAPARIKADIVLAPKDSRLEQLISQMKLQKQFFEESKKPVERDTESGSDDGKTVRPTAPPSAVIYLFDPVVSYLRADIEGPIHSVARRFDPTRGPIQNLPGERLNSGQRAFVENVWRPLVRPQLVAAGFPRVATLGT